MMKHEQSRAFYGPKHVFSACEADAIEVLMISDKLFRANNVLERRKYVDLVDKVGLFYRFLFKLGLGDLLHTSKSSKGDDQQKVFMAGHLTLYVCYNSSF